MARQTINNRYIVYEQLGTGSTGVVYRAIDRLNNEAVALKRITTTQTDDASSASNRVAISFAREFQTLASLHHPYIIGVKDYGFANKQPFFTMELLDNPATILEAGRHLGDQAQIDLLIQMLEALAYLHRHSILHRDLKPTNVYVTNGRVRVLDFGLSVPRTQAIGVVGTLAYMAPEVMQGDTATEASDLYAVGVIAYELLVGQHPYGTGSSLKNLLLNLLTDEPDYAALDYDIHTLLLEQHQIVQSTQLPDIPIHSTSRLGEVVRRLLARNPVDRYQDAEDVIRDLAAAINRPPPIESSAIRESFLQAPVFVGRDAELGLLEQALNQAQAGHGSAWLVGGESGVGRSRLLEELHSRALVNGFLVLDGRASADMTTSFGLWRAPLRRLLLSSEVDDLEASILRAVIPDIDSLLGRPIPSSHDHQPSQLVSTIVSLFRRNTHPTILLLDDLHWAIESLSVLQALLTTIHECPLLIIGSYREEATPDLPQRLPDMLTFRLDRLNIDDIAEISASILGETGRRPEVVTLLQQETEGNVFFLIEIIRTLARQARRLPDVGKMTLPDHVLAGGMQSILEGRLAAVPPWAMDLLQLAAVAGREIDPVVLKHINRLENHSFDEWLLACADAAILEVHDSRWRFTHDKLREGILARLPHDIARHHHRLIGEAIELMHPNHQPYAARQVIHWQVAGDHQREAYYARLAGLQALRNNALEEARSYLERALELSDEVTYYEHMEIALHLGEVLDHLSHYGKAKTHYLETLRLADQLEDIQVQATVHSRLGGIAAIIGDYQTAHTHYLTSLAHYQSFGDRHGQSRALCSLGNLAKQQSDQITAIDLYHQALALSDRHDDSLILSNLGDVYFRMGRFQEAIQNYEQALTLKRQSGDRRNESMTLDNLGSVYCVLGELDRSLAFYEQALNLKRNIGDRLGIGQVSGHMAHVYRLQVRIDTAIQLVLEAYSISQDIGDRSGEASSLATLGNCYHDLGQISRAIHHYQQALQIARELNDQRSLSYLLAYIGKAYLDLQQPKQARDALREALTLAKRIQDRHSEGQVLCALGELDDDMTTLQQAVTIADEMQVPELMLRGRALLAANYLMNGQPGQTREIATEARRLNMLAHNHWLDALLGLALLLEHSNGAARTAFINAINEADQLLALTPDYAPAHLTRTLAGKGLSLLSGTNLSQTGDHSFPSHSIDRLLDLIPHTISL